MKNRQSINQIHHTSVYLESLLRPRFVCLLLAVGTLAVFWRVKNCEFVNYDDPSYVSANAQVLGGLTANGLRWSFSTDSNGNWHPITWLSHMLDAELFGPTPLGPHVMNLLFHVANSVLLFLVLRRITGAHWQSAFVAALFAWHPLHVESVAWISERKDVLSTFFFLLTIMAYGRYAQKRSKAEDRGSSAGAALDLRHSAFDYFLALLFFAMGLMSKPMLVSLPFVLLLLDYWPLKRVSGGRGQVSEGEKPGDPLLTLNPSARRSEAETAQPTTLNQQLSTFRLLFREKIPFFALSAACGVVTWIAQQRSGALHTLEDLPLSVRLENAVVSYARYLGKIVWPVDLALPYPHPGHWPWTAVTLSVLLVAGISAAALWFARRWPFLVTGWFWFVGILVPVIGLVQVGIQALADRYTYVPSIGIFIVLAWGTGRLWARAQAPKAILAGAALMVLIAGAMRTMDQLGYWKNSGSLFSHALAVTEENYVAHDNLASYFFEQGSVDQAMEHCQQALQINPRDPLAHNNLGHGLLFQGRMDGAIRSFQRALELRPDYATAWQNLGGAYLQGQKYPEAIRCYQQAVQLRPDSAEAHHKLGGAFLMQKQFSEAIACFDMALRLQADYVPAHVLLGAALYETGRTNDAIDQYEAALRLAPDDATAHAFLAEVLRRQGRVAEASAHLKEALRLEPGNMEAEKALRKLEAPAP